MKKDNKYISDNEESVRILEFMDNKKIKVPISTIGEIECSHEIFIYSMASSEYKKHLLPILDVQGNILIIPKVTPLSKLYKEKVIDVDEMQKNIQSLKDVALYLSERFSINQEKLLNGYNVAFYQENLVFIHYGYKKDII